MNAVEAEEFEKSNHCVKSRGGGGYNPTDLQG